MLQRIHVNLDSIKAVFCKKKKKKEGVSQSAKGNCYWHNEVNPSDAAFVTCAKTNKLQNKQLSNDQFVNHIDQTTEKTEVNGIKARNEVLPNQSPDKQQAQKEQENMTKAEGNQQVMDVKLVVKMFQDLKKEITDMKQENREKKEERDEQTKATAGEIASLKEEVSSYKYQNEILTSVVERLGNLFIDVDRRINQIDAKLIKKAIVFSGIETADNIVKCQSKVENFLTELGFTEYEITDCFKLGLGTNKPVVITLSTMTQKLNILQEMNKFKKRAEGK